MLKFALRLAIACSATASCDPGSAQQTTAAKPAPTVEWQRRETVEFSGSVVDGEGQGLAGAELIVAPAWKRIAVDEDGSFLFRLLPEQVTEARAYLHAEGFGMQVIRLQAEQTQLGAIQLQPARAWGGTLKDASGAAIPNARLQLRAQQAGFARGDRSRLWLDAALASESGFALQEATTDEEGRFEFPCWVDDRFELFAFEASERRIAHQSLAAFPDRQLELIADLRSLAARVHCASALPERALLTITPYRRTLLGPPEPYGQGVISVVWQPDADGLMDVQLSGLWGNPQDWAFYLELDGCVSEWGMVQQWEPQVEGGEPASASATHFRLAPERTEALTLVDAAGEAVVGAHLMPIGANGATPEWLESLQAPGLRVLARTDRFGRAKLPPLAQGPTRLAVWPPHCVEPQIVTLSEASTAALPANFSSRRYEVSLKIEFRVQGGHREPDRSPWQEFLIRAEGTKGETVGLWRVQHVVDDLYRLDLGGHPAGARSESIQVEGLNFPLRLPAGRFQLSLLVRDSQSQQLLGTHDLGPVDVPPMIDGTIILERVSSSILPD